MAINSGPGTWGASSRAFHDWLRLELKARRMSQRQLAQRSGIDHSTVSRIIRDERRVSLSTATKLARVLRGLGSEADGGQSLGVVPTALPTPTTRVERALRADELLSDADVRQIMEAYLALRSAGLGDGTARAASTSTRSAARSP